MANINLTNQKCLLSSILNGLAESVVVIDKAGIIQTVNQAWVDFATGNNADNAVIQGIGLNYLEICKHAVTSGDDSVSKILEGIVSVLNGSVNNFVHEYPCHSPETQRWFRMHVTRLSDAPGGAVISHFNITDLWQTHQELCSLTNALELKVRERTSEIEKINISLTDEIRNHEITESSLQQFRSALDSSSDGVYIIDPHNMKFVDANKTAWQMLGYSHDELLTMGPQDIKPESVIAELRRNFDRVLAGEIEQAIIDTTHRCRDGRLIPVEVRIRKAETGNNEKLLVAVARDITEKKKRNRALLESRETLRALLDAAEDDYFMLLDRDNVVVQLNQSMARSLNVAMDAILGKRLFDYLPDEVRESRKQWLNTVYDTKLPVSFEDQRGSRYFHSRLYPILDEQGEIIRVAILARDITEMKMATERRIVQEREHKETLVREVHHRIKNNLQSVAGLLRRQARLWPNINDVLKEAISQVEVVAIVHGLQGSAGEGHLYLCDMVPNIARTAMGLDRGNVSHTFTNLLPNMVTLKSEEAVPLALILNELITNALKHSVEDEKILNICLRREHDNRASVYIENNGILPDDFDFTHGVGLGTGLTLVRSLMPEKGVEISISHVENKVLVHVLLDERVMSFDARTCPPSGTGTIL